MQRRRVKQVASLEDRIAERINALTIEAQAFPPGSKEREKLELKVRRASALAHMEVWLTSPGLRPPT